jgi:hypothetical protein
MNRIKMKFSIQNVLRKHSLIMDFRRRIHPYNWFILLFFVLFFLFCSCDPASAFIHDKVYIKNSTSQDLIMEIPAAYHFIDTIHAGEIICTEMYDPLQGEGCYERFILSNDTVKIYSINGIELKTWGGPFRNAPITQHDIYNRNSWSVETERLGKRSTEVTRYYYTFTIEESDITP